MNFNKLSKKLETLGNKIPHPFWLFIILSVITILLSLVFSRVSISFNDSYGLRNVKISNLANTEYLVNLLGNMDEIFLNFKPLSVVILILMGISVFQGSGAISAVIRGITSHVPIKMLVFFAAFIGVNSNIASDVAVVVVPTLFAALFQTLNLNPWIGIIVGYASVNGGWALNIFIAGTDAIMSEITNTVLTGYDTSTLMNPFSNWIFMFFGAFLVILITVIITEKYTKKILPDYIETNFNSTIDTFRLSKGEKRGLRNLLYANILYFSVLVIVAVQYGRHPGSFGMNIRFITNNLVGIIFLYFTISGIVFGISSGSMKKISVLPTMFAEGINGAKSFIVTALSASVFVKLLTDSNMDSLIGVGISYLLLKMKMPPLFILLVFMLAVSIINVLINSGAVKWIFIAPIALPLFIELGISAPVIQLAYRIGDSVTNCISPTDYYLPVIISLLDMYKMDSETKTGIGTVISLCLPYALAYFAGLIVMFVVWYLFAIPVGF